MLKVGQMVFIARSHVFIFRKRKLELKNFLKTSGKEGKEREAGREIMWLWVWGKKRGNM